MYASTFGRGGATSCSGCPPEDGSFHCPSWRKRASPTPDRSTPLPTPLTDPDQIARLRSDDATAAPNPNPMRPPARHFEDQTRSTSP
jgi:hypothetical protein